MRDTMAHGDVVHGPSDVLHAWSLEPVVLGGLAILAWAYARGAAALRARTGDPVARALPAWRVRCYWSGFAALVVALVSPVDPVGEAIFSGHMVQHLLLTMIAAPLLVLGDAGTILLWALPRVGRRAVGRVLRARLIRSFWRLLSHPLSAWLLHGAALVVWHLPVPYEMAVRHDGVHALEHVSFLATALIYWWCVAAPRARQRLGFGASVLYLFTAAVASSVLGAMISMASVPWYTVHARSAEAWGLTALEDQQLAGLIMWVPAGILYLVAIAPLCLHALSLRVSGRAASHAS